MASRSLPASLARTRRQFLGGLTAATWAAAAHAQSGGFRLRYILSSSLYGDMPLEQVLPQVSRVGATGVDLWPKPHGTQREQAAAMGDAEFAHLLARHGTALGCVTRFDLDPAHLVDEMKWGARFGCRLYVCGAGGPRGLRGTALQSAIEAYVERMLPTCEAAEALGATIAIENHGNGLLESIESVQRLIETASSPALGVALAPYHLPQDEPALASLIRECGSRLRLFYAWQYGAGCTHAMPKDEELLQLPGRGSLDFSPLVAALREIDFQGPTSIFMHPTPRGKPIVEGGPDAVSAEIIRARQYLDSLA